MKLAIVSPYPPDITGIGQYGLHVSRALAQSRQFSEITVLAGARGQSRLNEIYTPMSIDYCWQPDQLGIGMAILAGIRRYKPDLIWFNLGASVFGRSPLTNLIGFMSLITVQLTGLPTVLTLHELVELTDLKTLNAPGGHLTLYGARLLTNLATRADVICLTMRRYINWLSTRRPDLACVHIPIGAYQPPEQLPESASPGLLFFSTQAPYKGLELLLTAYQSLLPVYPNLRLSIAGADHPRFPGYAEALRREYASLTGVQWLGQVPEDQIRGMFAQAQVVILPYLASTGSSSVLHQAAMWGRAVVASDIAEIRAVVEEGTMNIEFFRNRDSTSLAGAIRTLLDSPACRQSQTEHNLNAIKRRPPEATCRAYLQAFNLALEAHHSPKRIEIPTYFPSELA